MHNDYLDPDRYFNQPEDYGHQPMLDALKAISTNRWRWDEIDCCWTGKDADLEPRGQQGLHFDYITEEKAYATAHIGKTFVGDDVTLNLPRSISDTLREKCHEAYMEQSQEVVCGCDCPGEWDGDSWFMSAQEKVSVDVVYTDDEPDYAATAKALRDAAQRSLADVERELVVADNIMSMLSGWRTDKGKPCKDGKPIKWAAYSHLLTA
jgi:hypothetical protein